MSRIGVLGSGTVGRTLGHGFVRHGHEVMLGSREPEKLADWVKETEGRGKMGTFPAAASFGSILVLAVKGQAALAALKAAGSIHLKGKTVIDATNPIDDAPPVHGVLRFFTGPNESLMERLQKAFPTANFVKAFNSVGHAHMVNPDFRGIQPTMFICGNSEGAKREVREIADSFGWETEDMGSVEAARAIEPLCMLWCIPGLSANRWSHAFKLLKK